MLVPQPHGGAIRRGALPGTNAGGWGRPPDELRALSRAGFHGIIVELVRRVDAGLLKNADLSELATLLSATGKYGIGEKVILELASPDVQARLEKQFAVIHRVLPTEQADALLDALDEVWA